MLPVFKAIYIALLAIGIVPYMTFLTRHVLAAVVLSIFLVFSLKLLGCVVVVLVYGWQAAEHGYTTTPWTQPNLLVWLFWLFSTVLSGWFYFLGGKKFSSLAPP